MICMIYRLMTIIKYIPLQQGLRPLIVFNFIVFSVRIIKYIPLQQGLRPFHPLT